MKKFSSWSKNAEIDAEKLGNAAASCACFFTGTAIFFAANFAGNQRAVPENFATEENALAVSPEIFVKEEIAVPEEILEPEIAQNDVPEELVPAEEFDAEIASEEEPEPEIKEFVPEEKIEEIAQEEPELSVPEKEKTVPEVAENLAEISAAQQTIYSILAEAIQRKKFYSKAARRLEATGTVFVKIKISEAGKIENFEVENSAGTARQLASNATEILRRVSEDFQIPADFLKNSEKFLPAEFVVPIKFELN